MGFKTDRMSAQDRVLNQFKHTIQSSGSFDNKPLSLAEQLAQVDNQPTKRVVNNDLEIEKRYNNPVYSGVRANKK